MHQNWDQLKVGDVVWKEDSTTGANHVFMVIGFKTNSSGHTFVLTGDGNSSGSVSWGGQENLKRWSDTKFAQSYIFSRY